MVKPIYCNLLLIFSCLMYEAYGSHPYNDSLSSSTTVNDAEENTATLESAAQSPSPRQKSFSSTDGLGYGRNYRSVQDNKFQHSMNRRMTSPPPRTLKKSFSSTDGLGYDRNHRSVQDNQFPRRMNRRMTLTPPCLLRNNLRRSIRNTKQQNGNDNFIMTKLMSGKLMPYRLNSLNRFGDSFNKDYDTQETEKPKNSMFGTSSNGDNDFIMPKLKDGKLKPLGQSSFNRFGHSFNEDSDSQKTETPKNMRLGSMGYSTNFPSFGSSNGMPNINSEKKKSNYRYSEPIGVSEKEANKIRNDVLQKSNFYRNKFDLQPFTLDDQLNNCAQDWANFMVKQRLFDHRPDNVYGENLYGNQNLKDLGATAVNSWYNEMSLFTIGNEENFDTFHMTQLLWKKSTKLGVGVSQNPGNGMYYVVANYDPRGNLLNHFKENLPEITEEDIEEAKEADVRLKAELAKPVVTSWSSGSSIPFGSEWRNYGSDTHENY